MRFRKRKKRTCDTTKYILEKALKIRQNCIILQTVTISLVMRTNVLIKPLLRNYLYQIQVRIKISCLKHD